MAGTRRLLTAAALAATSAGAAASLGGVFVGDDWVLPVLVAACTPHAVGVIVRPVRRGEAPVVGVAVLAGLLAAIWTIFPDTTTGGIPGDETLRALREAVDEGWSLVRRARVPVEAHDGPVLLAAAVAWLSALVADHLAFRRAATVGALTPALVLLVWTSAIGGEGGGGTGPAAACSLAACGFLLLRHQTALTASSAAHSRTHTGFARRSLGSGLLTAVGAVALGVVVAPALPGTRGGPLLDFGGDEIAGNYRAGVAPLVEVAERLRRGERVELFTVRARAPMYWRLLALDEYESAAGGRWTLNARGGDVGEGLDEPAPEDPFTQEFRVGLLGERWMPAAYRPVEVSVEPLVVRSSSTMVIPRRSVSGTRYRVVSNLAVLDATAARRLATDTPVPRSLRRFARLPADFPATVADLAQSVTAGAATPFDRATALRDFFRDGSFAYDPTTDLVDDPDAIVQFLAERRGFCVQFASAFATMARTLGIPARVAVGFTPGSRDPEGTFHVTTDEAHAWPEIWLAGLGWTGIFDPTPPSPLAGGSDLPGDTASSGAPARQGEPTATTQQGAGSPTPDPEAPRAPVVRPTEPTDEGAGAVIILLVGVAALAVTGAVATGGAVVTAKWLRTRRRRRRATTSAVAGAWHDTLDRLLEAGIDDPPAATPLELATVSAPQLGAAADSLRTLAATYTAACYAPERPSVAVAERAWGDARAVARALANGTSRRERMRRRLDPAPLRRRDE